MTTVLPDAVRGLDALDSGTVDAELRAADGSSDLSTLGANAVLVVSISTALAAADAQRIPLYRSVAAGADSLAPLPKFDIISGGAHAGRSTDVQDFLAVLVRARYFSEAIEYTNRVRATGPPTSSATTATRFERTAKWNPCCRSNLSRAMPRHTPAPAQDLPPPSTECRH